MTQLERRLLAGLVGVDLRTVISWECDPRKTREMIARELERVAKEQSIRVVHGKVSS